MSDQTWFQLAGIGLVILVCGVPWIFVWLGRDRRPFVRYRDVRQPGAFIMTDWKHWK
jgi:hypothetical protein